MPINAEYRGPGELPEVIAVFPLPGALLLPRGQMPLNIFEPRYLAMVDDALRDGHRLIGMIQPDAAHSSNEDPPALFRARCARGIQQVRVSAGAVSGRVRRTHHAVGRVRRRPLHSRAPRSIAIQGGGGDLGADLVPA